METKRLKEVLLLTIIKMPKNTNKPTACLYFAYGGIMRQGISVIGCCMDKFEDECYAELIKKYGDVTTGRIMDANAEAHFDDLKEKTKDHRVGSDSCVKVTQKDLKDMMRKATGDEEGKTRVLRFPKKVSKKDGDESDDEKEEEKKPEKKGVKKAPVKKPVKKEEKKESEDEKSEKEEKKEPKKKAPAKKTPVKKAPAKKAPAKKESDDDKSDDDKSDDDTTDESGSEKSDDE